MKNTHDKYRESGILNTNKILEYEINTRCQIKIKLSAVLQGTVHPGIIYFSIQK